MSSNDRDLRLLNPTAARVTPLDSSDTLYVVYLAYTVKPMDNVVCFQHPCVGPVRFTFYVLRTHLILV
jgi:hypothetical protein